MSDLRFVDDLQVDSMVQKYHQEQQKVSALRSGVASEQGRLDQLYSSFEDITKKSDEQKEKNHKLRVELADMDLQLENVKSLIDNEKRMQHAVYLDLVNTEHQAIDTDKKLRELRINNTMHLLAISEKQIKKREQLDKFLKIADKVKHLDLGGRGSDGGEGGGRREEEAEEEDDEEEEGGAGGGGGGKMGVCA